MRPKKQQSERLTTTAQFRVTALEKAQLERTAKQCGMSVSDFCRAAVFGTQPKERLTAEQQELLKDVRHIRLDLDRLSRHWRVQGWSDVYADIKQIIVKLKPILNL